MLVHCLSCGKTMLRDGALNPVQRFMLYEQRSPTLYTTYALGAEVTPLRWEVIDRSIPEAKHNVVARFTHAAEGQRLVNLLNGVE